MRDSLILTCISIFLFSAFFSRRALYYITILIACTPIDENTENTWFREFREIGAHVGMHMSHTQQDFRLAPPNIKNQTQQPCVKTTYKNQTVLYSLDSRSRW
jgi:hypothetical protein